MPYRADVSEAFAIPDLPESLLEMQGAAGVIACNDLSLQGPVGLSLRDCNQLFQEGGADSLAMSCDADVDADLSNPGGASAIGDRSKRTPAEEAAILPPRNQPSDRKVRCIPFLPDRRRGQERCQAGRQPFSINCADLRPILALHRFDCESHSCLVKFVRIWFPVSARQRSVCPRASRPMSPARDVSLVMVPPASA